MNGTARVALIVPTYNEEESIGWVLAQIPADAVQRVIVADGGSTDRTAAIASSVAADVLTVGRGFGRACLEGAIAAADADILVFMDGDGADDPAYIPMLVQPILSDEADFVIGSRIRGTREPGSMAWHQVAAGWMAGAGIYLASGVRFTDMCTFRAIRRRTLLDLGLREMTYGWNIEMQVRAARAGLRIREIPVRYRCRHGGTSKVAGNVGTSLKAGARIAATFVRVGLSGARRSASSKL
jgi:glycosyltransferase involved in cell wall biosynthesis